MWAGKVAVDAAGTFLDRQCHKKAFKAAQMEPLKTGARKRRETLRENAFLNSNDAGKGD